MPQVDLAVPAFGYNQAAKQIDHISIDRRHGLVRGWTTTHAAARLVDVLDADTTASGVWADTAYRSAKNETMPRARGLISCIHRKKPVGRPISARTRRANGGKSAMRSRIETVFAHQKGLMALFIRTIGIARAKVKIGLANLAYNIRRFVWLNARIEAN